MLASDNRIFLKKTQKINVIMIKDAIMIFLKTKKQRLAKCKKKNDIWKKNKD